MAEKILNTRIQLKYDSLANWNASTFKLKAGELAIVTVGEMKDGSTHSNAQYPVLFKVGTGNHTFSELPFASALAADVYDWAKAAKVELVGKEIQFQDANGAKIRGVILNYITEAEATNLINTALAAYSTTADMNAAIKVETDRATGAESGLDTRLKVVEAAVGENGSVATQIQTAIEGLDSTASQAAGADGLALGVTLVDGKVTSITGSIAANTYDAYGAAAAVQGNVDTLAGLVGTLPADAGVDTVVAYVQKKTEGIATDAALTELTDRVKDAEDAIDAIEADYLKSTDKTALEGKITEAQTAAEGKVTELANGAVKANTEAIAAINDGATGILAQAKEDATSKANAAQGAAKTYTDEEIGKVNAEVAKKAAQSDLEAETARATGVEAGLRTDVNAIKADYLKAADKTELSNAINTEKARAEAAEAGLQTQINTIMNNPDTEGVINSINEFTQYVTEHGEIAEGFRTDIDANEAAIEELKAYVGELPAEYVIIDQTIEAGGFEEVSGTYQKTVTLSKPFTWPKYFDYETLNNHNFRDLLVFNNDTMTLYGGLEDYGTTWNISFYNGDNRIGFISMPASGTVEEVTIGYIQELHTQLNLPIYYSVITGTGPNADTVVEYAEALYQDTLNMGYALHNRIAALESSMGTDGSVADQISAAIATETAARKEAVQGVQDQIDALNITDGKVENAVNADKATVASGLDAAGIAQVQDIKVNEAGTADVAKSLSENAKAEVAAVKVNNATNADVAAKASGLDASGEAAVKAVKVDNAAHADTADNATSAADAAKLGGVAAADYALKAQVATDIATAKSEAIAAAATDAQTKADAALAAAKEDSSNKDAVVLVEAQKAATAAETAAKAYADGLAGGYATKAQGEKADTALQSVEAGTGLKVSTKADNKQTIDIDETVVFVFDCGSASKNID